MIQTFKYYKMALLPASLVVIAIYIFWSIIEYDPNYKSEWMNNGFAFLWGIMLVITNILFVALLSTTIFFNNFPVVRNNVILSFIAWFLSPMVWIGFLLSITFKIHASSKDWSFLLVNSIPFLAGLVWGFIRYRQGIIRSFKTMAK
ncbi:MAG: hypothetical protein GY827_06440 [Cytophagales bacterium]|nr:hypothetical protein [Cytophagales bacterium]